MLEAILSQALRKEHRAAGLYLDEEDDHLLHLKYGTKRLATFSERVELKILLDEADQQLMKLQMAETLGAKQASF
jgi:hypothetical protein